MTRCCECRKKKQMFRAVTRHVDCTIDFICLECWNRLDYRPYMDALSSLTDRQAVQQANGEAT